MSGWEQRFTDRFGVTIVLDPEHRDVIHDKHPESRGLMDRLPQVLADPDEIRRSVRREDAVLYYRYDPAVFGGKWLVAVVKRADRAYISTYYVTDRIKSGEVMWTK